MSAPDYPPAETEARQIIGLCEKIIEQQARLVEAVNGWAANQQWIVDNVKDIFAAFGNPQMLQMMGGVMGGMMPPGTETVSPNTFNLTVGASSDNGNAASGGIAAATGGPAVPASGT